MDAVSELLRTTDFAARKHKNQRRKNEEAHPYINHPIGVANILANEGGVTDLVVLQSALLHDTVEDTDTTLEEIEENFGKTIRSVVAEVTDDKSLPKAKRKRLQVETAPNKSREAKLIKLADKLYNLRDLQGSPPVGWPEERVQEYYEWAGQVLRGCVGTNAKLEEELEKVLATRGVSMKSKEEDK